MDEKVPDCSYEQIIILTNQGLLKKEDEIQEIVNKQVIKCQHAIYNAARNGEKFITIDCYYPNKVKKEFNGFTCRLSHNGGCGDDYNGVWTCKCQLNGNTKMTISWGEN